MTVDSDIMQTWSSVGNLFFCCVIVWTECVGGDFDTFVTMMSWN